MINDTLFLYFSKICRNPRFHQEHFSDRSVCKLSIPKVTAGMRLSYAYTFFFFQITPVIQYKVSPKVHKYNILTNSNNTL